MPRKAKAPGRPTNKFFPNRLTLGIDEAGRGPAVGPMVMAAVALDSKAAAALTRKGLRDSKAYGAGEDAHLLRSELNVLERECAIRMITLAPSCDKIIADGKRMFSSLTMRYEQFISIDHAEDHHAAVAAASVIAKVLRDDRFNAIRARYEPEFGPITGGGYSNAHTRKWVRAYCEKHGKLPDEARKSWPHTYVHDLIGDTTLPSAQQSLFS